MGNQRSRRRARARKSGRVNSQWSSVGGNGKTTDSAAVPAQATEISGGVTRTARNVPASPQALLAEYLAPMNLDQRLHALQDESATNADGLRLSDLIPGRFIAKALSAVRHALADRQREIDLMRRRCACGTGPRFANVTSNPRRCRSWPAYYVGSGGLSYECWIESRELDPELADEIEAMDNDRQRVGAALVAIPRDARRSHWVRIDGG